MQKRTMVYYYQYIFIDEYSPFRYLEAFKEKNTYTSTMFLKHMVEKFPPMPLSISRRMMVLNLPIRQITAGKSI